MKEEKIQDKFGNFRYYCQFDSAIDFKNYVNDSEINCLNAMDLFNRCSKQDALNMLRLATLKSRKGEKI